MRKSLLMLLLLFGSVSVWAQGYDVSINSPKATVTSGGSKTLDAVATEIGNNSSVTTVIMPSGFTTSSLKEFADKIANVKTAVSTTTKTQTVPAYFYDTDVEYTGTRGSEDGHITGTVKANVTLSQVGEPSYKVTSSGEAYTGTYIFVSGENVYGCEDGNVISITKIENAYTYTDGSKKIYDASRGVTSDGKGNVGGTATTLTNSEISYYYTENAKNYAFINRTVFDNGYSQYFGYNGGDDINLTKVSSGYMYSNNPSYYYEGLTSLNSYSQTVGHVGGTQVSLETKNIVMNGDTPLDPDRVRYDSNSGKYFACFGGEKTTIYLLDRECYAYRANGNLETIDETISAEGNQTGSDGQEHYFYKLDSNYKYYYLSGEKKIAIYGTPTLYGDDGMSYYPGSYETSDNIALKEVKTYNDGENDIVYSGTVYGNDNNIGFIGGEEVQLTTISEPQYYYLSEAKKIIYVGNRSLDNAFGHIGGTPFQLVREEKNVDFYEDGYGNVIYTGAVYVAGDNRYAYEGGTQVTLTQETIYKNGSEIYEGAVAENAGNYYGVAESNQIPLTAELKYSYTNPSDSKTPETIQITSPIPLSTAENAYEVDRTVYLTQDTKEVPAGDELAVYVKEDGALASYIAGMTNEEKNAAQRISVAGSMSEADMDFSALTSLNTLNISEADVVAAEACKLKTYNNAKVNVIDVNDLSSEDLLARYMNGSDMNYCLAAVYSQKTTASDETSEKVVLVADIAAAKLSENASNVDNLVICSKQNVVIASTMSDLLVKVSDCADVKTLVLSKVGNFGSQKYDFTKLNNSSIKRVILPDNQNISDITKATSNIPVYQVYNSTTQKVTIEVTQAGRLGECKDTHYYSTDIDNAYWIEVKGNINHEDVDFINGIHNDRLNLSQATNAGNEEDFRAALHDFTNNYVKYLAWPVFTTEPSNPLYTDLYEHCNSLVAVGQFVADTTDPGYGKLVANTKEEGGIKYVTEMLGEVTKKPASTTSNSAIKHAKISGNLKAEDLFHETTSSARGLAADGHLYLYPAADEYGYTQGRISVDGLEGITDEADAEANHKPTVHEGALGGLYNIVSLDLSDAVFSRYEDMTLSKLGIVGSETKTIVLPTSSSVKDIPADFMNVSCKLNEIMIPSNIENIHARAFGGSDVMHVWTNTTSAGVACDNGATYELDEAHNLGSYTDEEAKPAGATMVYGTYTLSPNLKFIGTNAFGASTHIHDVYMLGKIAPVCNVDAFSTVSYVANNSYLAAAVPVKIDRDAYANSKYAWMTMLHFPAECTDDEAKLYTDITRRYSIASDKRDGNGNIVYYPTQCEWNRSFVQGTTGYLWNAFCNKRNPYSGTAMAFYINNAWHQQALEDGTPNNNTQNNILYGTGTAQSAYQSIANSMYNINDEDESVKSKEVFYDTSSDGSTALAYNKTLYNADYRGWHQFVLAEYGYSDKIVVNFEDFYDSNWWTICEPFPLTSAELKKGFGDNVKLCKLVSVTRNVEKGGLRLNFGPNLVGTDTGGGYTLQAGVPYMIKPALPTGGTTLDQKITYEVNNATDNIERFAEKTEEQLKNLLINGMYTVPAYLVNNTGEFKEPSHTDDNGKEVHTKLSYTMMGTFFKYYLPQYCYFLGWDNSYGGPAFFWHDQVADKGDRNWNPYTAIIVPNWVGADNPFENPATGEFDTIHYRYSSTGAIGETDDFGRKFEESKRMTLHFAADEDDETTEIATVHVGNDMFFNGNVYNMNGQLVRTNGTLSSLPKGVYIVNGKKYISK